MFLSRPLIRKILKKRLVRINWNGVRYVVFTEHKNDVYVHPNPFGQCEWKKNDDESILHIHNLPLQIVPENQFADTRPDNWIKEWPPHPKCLQVSHNVVHEHLRCSQRISTSWSDFFVLCEDNHYILVGPQKETITHLFGVYGSWFRIYENGFHLHIQGFDMSISKVRKCLKCFCEDEIILWCLVLQMESRRYGHLRNVCVWIRACISVIHTEIEECRYFLKYLEDLNKIRAKYNRRELRKSSRFF